VSASDGAEIATLQIGKRPDAVIWDVARKLFFIPSGGDGLLTVIARRSPAEFAVVDQVATRLGARTGALDPATGRIYLPTATLNPTATGRPTPVPGTFVVLVVGGE
ncbi:MAG: YncE family protein, partial [Alphaproteobacteria bacterium]